jgi:hypothetical protein
MKHLGIRGLLEAVLALLLLFGVGIPAARAQGRCPEVEQYPNNLIFNCSFERGWLQIPLGEIGEGWEYSVEGGQPALDHSTFERLHGSTAQRIWTDGVPFDATIYQRVDNVTPGAAYVAAVDWAAVSPSLEDNIERRVGIDAFGGTDPASPNVVWSGAIWTWGHDFSALRVSAFAQATTVTVFVRVHVQSSAGKDEAFIDLVHLELDPTQPMATATAAPPAATPTSPPPSFTSTPLPPTETPRPTDTPPPTATSTVQSTSTPVPTHTSQPAPTATTAPEASQTPLEVIGPNAAALPTATSEAPAVTPVPAPQREAYDWIPTILVAVTAASFLGAGVLGILLLVLRHS